MEKIKFESVEQYMATFPENTQEMLQILRNTIKAVAPDAEECISYNMPAYKLKGVLVYFAAYKNHIGFYPTGSGIKAFEKEIADYKWSKGAVQFAVNQPLPLDLISKMVAFRVFENQKKSSQKNAK